MTDERLNAIRWAWTSGRVPEEADPKLRAACEDFELVFAALAAREEALAAAQAENERLVAVIQGAIIASEDFRMTMALERALASRPGEGEVAS